MWPFAAALVLLVWGFFVLGFLAEPSAVANLRVALLVIGVGSVALGVVAAAAGVWMLVSRRT
jgi:hypothetical protein